MDQRSRNQSKMKQAKRWVLDKFRKMRTALSCFTEPKDDAISEFDADALAECDVEDLPDYDADALAECDVEDLPDFDADALAEQDVDGFSECDADALAEIDADALAEIDADALNENDADVLAEIDADDFSEFDADALAEIDADDFSEFDADALAEIDVDDFSECDADQCSLPVLEYPTDMGFKSAKEYLNEPYGTIVLDEELIFTQESYIDQLIVDLLRLPSNESSEIESGLVLVPEIRDIREIIDAPQNLPTNEESNVDHLLDFVQESQLEVALPPRRRERPSKIRAREKRKEKRDGEKHAQ